jgi:hypothetical protein
MGDGYDDIFDVDEVAGLFFITEDCDGLIGQRFANKMITEAMPWKCWTRYEPMKPAFL